jgi:hypothetical protein
MQPVPEVKKAPSFIPSDWVLWYQSLSLACYIYIICGLYVGGLEGLVNPKLVNIAVGHTGMIMVILSMGMSSITYYWHVADHAMLFRKYFGIVDREVECSPFFYSKSSEYHAFFGWTCIFTYLGLYDSHFSSIGYQIIWRESLA